MFSHYLQILYEKQEKKRFFILVVFFRKKNVFFFFHRKKTIYITTSCLSHVWPRHGLMTSRTGGARHKLPRQFQIFRWRIQMFLHLFRNSSSYSSPHLNIVPGLSVSWIVLLLLHIIRRIFTSMWMDYTKFVNSSDFVWMSSTAIFTLCCSQRELLVGSFYESLIVHFYYVIYLFSFNY